MDIIQIIWFLIPAVILLFGLYSYLEKLGKSVKKQNPKDFFKSGIFALIVAIVTFIIDKFFLVQVTSYLPSLIPLLFYRLILFPLVMYVLAMFIGGSKPASLQKKNNRP
jgi:hypothetical protein